MLMATSLKWKQLFFAIILISNTSVYSSISKKIKYKSSFNNCPSQSAGKFAMKALKKFEETNSLYDVKTEINDNFLQDKYFIKNYAIEVDPTENVMNITLNCPLALLRVVLMDSEAQGEFQSVLVDGGELFDPTYETLLLGEKKLKTYLPTLAIHKDNLNEKNRVEISRIIKSLGSENLSKISEVIFDNEKVLTMILSLNKKPVSVFLGKGNYGEKTAKLRRLLKYVHANNKQPKVINLVNVKKVVVKFAHKK
jgi:hypothetical protein